MKEQVLHSTNNTPTFKTIIEKCRFSFGTFKNYERIHFRTISFRSQANAHTYLFVATSFALVELMVVLPTISDQTAVSSIAIIEPGA